MISKAAKDLLEFFQSLPSVNINNTPNIVFRKELLSNLKEDLKELQVYSPLPAWKILTAQTISAKMDVDLSAFGDSLNYEEHQFVTELAKATSKAIVHIGLTTVNTFGLNNFVEMAAQTSVKLT